MDIRITDLLKDSKIENISFMKVAYLDQSVKYGDLVEFLLPSGKRIYAKIAGKIQDEKIIAITRVNRYQAMKILFGKRFRRIKKDFINKIKSKAHR